MIAEIIKLGVLASEGYSKKYLTLAMCEYFTLVFPLQT